MRAAQAQAKNAANAAGTAAGTYGTEGATERGILLPFLTQELTSQHAFSPEQLNQLLTAAGAGAGGATGALESKGELEAARTRNTGNPGAMLDAAQREREMALAKSSEGVAAKDVEGAAANRQEAAKGLGELYGIDTGAALKSMGIQTQDINAEIEAGKTGWFQNMTNLISSLSGAAKGPGAYI